jgi:hypothetical protein
MLIGAFMIAKPANAAVEKLAAKQIKKNIIKFFSDTIAKFKRCI